MEIKNTQKDYDDVASINMLVYGVGGVGKTTFASTFPKPLLFDFENGAKYFKQRGINVDVVNMKGWFTKEDILELKEVIKDYETIVIDPIGEAMEKLIKSNHITGSKYRQSGGDLTMAGWGKVKDDFRWLMKFLRDTNKHIVLVAHVNEKTDEETLVKRPMIATKISDQLIAMVDIVGYLDVIKVENEDKRIIRVNPADRKYIAKDRTDALITEKNGIIKPEFDYIYNLIKSKQVNGKKEELKGKTTKKSQAKSKTKK